MSKSDKDFFRFIALLFAALFGVCVMAQAQTSVVRTSAHNYTEVKAAEAATEAEFAAIKGLRKVGALTKANGQIYSVWSDGAADFTISRAKSGKWAKRRIFTDDEKAARKAALALKKAANK